MATPKKKRMPGSASQGLSGNPKKAAAQRAARAQSGWQTAAVGPSGDAQPAAPTRRPVPKGPVTARDWVGAARLRTLPLAVSPVLVGTGAAYLVDHELHWLRALACLIIAVCLQIGVNFANDYSDGIRGTDDFRVGPARLTASGRVAPRAVLTAALIFFGTAALAGLALVVRTGQWWLLAVGAVCILAAWFYTGGKRPYGYNALGELFVFVFFGLVATVGTTWVQVFSIPQEAWFGAVGVGLLACAVLLANNLRDIYQDRQAGKRTLSVIIGKRATQILFTLYVLIPFAIAAYLALFYPIAWFEVLPFIAGLAAILIVWMYREPRELLTALAITSFTSLAYGAILFWAFVG